MNSLPRWDIYINMWAINGGNNKYILVGSADVTHTINVEKSRLLTGLLDRYVQIRFLGHILVIYQSSKWS